MVAAGVQDLARTSAGGGTPVLEGTSPGRRPRTGAAIAVAGLGLSILLSASQAASGGVLSENDLKRVESIKPLFQSLMIDLVETTKRPDLSGADADCIKSAITELTQISGELSSYEYLMTIEKDMTDFGENNPMKGVVKYAVEKTNTILTTERKRLAELSDRCASYPLSFGKTQQTLRVIDSTTTILNSIQSRL
jgi:hypothetical protein